MSETLNLPFVTQNLEEERRHVLLRTIRNWRKNLANDDPEQPSVIIYSLGNLSDKVILVALSLCASSGIWIPQVSIPSPEKHALADSINLVFGAGSSLSPDQIKAQLHALKGAIFSVPEPLFSSKKAWEFPSSKSIPDQLFNSEEWIGHIMTLVYMSGAKSVVFDIRVNGNFIVRNQREGRDFARRMRNVCNQCGIHSSYILCNANHFIGQAAGEYLEIKEALEVLMGKGPLDLTKVAMEVASEVVRLAYPLSQITEIKKSLRSKIEEGKALEIFKKMITFQGGNALYVNDITLFPKVKKSLPVLSEKEGFLHNLDENKLACFRSEMDVKPKNLGDGFTILKKRGDRIKKGDLLAEIFHDGMKNVSVLMSRFKDLFVIDTTPPPFEPLIIEKIREEELS
jgi:pyrimidine-nucleoside phosphorylase